MGGHCGGENCGEGRFNCKRIQKQKRFSWFCLDQLIKGVPRKSFCTIFSQKRVGRGWHLVNVLWKRNCFEFCHWGSGVLQTTGHASVRSLMMIARCAIGRSRERL